MQPIIGIATSVDVNRLGMVINSLPVAYSTAIEKAGGLPLVLPFSKDQTLLQLMLRNVDGLLLPGGIDLDPAWFNEAPVPGLEQVDRDLDIFQFALFQAAFSLQKPVLGICRGCQLINVALAGNLFQDIFSQRQLPPLQHRGPDYDTEHLVSIRSGSRLASLFGAEVRVNSRHHQAIKDVSPNLWVTAVAPDGVIEAAEHRSLPIHLVQWHPERMLMQNDLMLPLFQDFVDQCGSGRILQ
jgi:putative glutamine amidotransferase